LYSPPPRNGSVPGMFGRRINYSPLPYLERVVRDTVNRFTLCTRIAIHGGFTTLQGQKTLIHDRYHNFARSILRLLHFDLSKLQSNNSYRYVLIHSSLLPTLVNKLTKEATKMQTSSRFSLTHSRGVAFVGLIKGGCSAMLLFTVRFGTFVSTARLPLLSVVESYLSHASRLLCYSDMTAHHHSLLSDQQRNEQRLRKEDDL
jgi:hypothetical protein